MHKTTSFTLPDAVVNFIQFLWSVQDIQFQTMAVISTENGMYAKPRGLLKKLVYIPKPQSLICCTQTFYNSWNSMLPFQLLETQYDLKFCTWCWFGCIMDVVVLLVALRDMVCPPTTAETLCWGVQLVPGAETPMLSEGRMLPWCNWTAGVTDEGGCWAAEDGCCCGADERGPCGGCGTAGEGGAAWGPSCWKLSVWLEGTAISVGPDGVCICCRCMGPCDVNRRRTCKHAETCKVIKKIMIIDITCGGDAFSLLYLIQQSTSNFQVQPRAELNKTKKSVKVYVNFVFSCLLPLHILII